MEYEAEHEKRVFSVLISDAYGLFYKIDRIILRNIPPETLIEEARMIIAPNVLPNQDSNNGRYPDLNTRDMPPLF